MSRFTKIPSDTFDGLQLDAGVLLNTFDPTSDAAIEDSAIICATTGGFEAVAKPTYADMGEDVDNCPVNMMELKKLEGWECTIKFTALTASAEMIRLALGAADKTVATGKVVPRRSLSQDDYADVWWVGDKANGGLVAVKLLNALSTEGLTLKTEKNSKGQIEVTLTGHVSLSAQDIMPMEFYSIDPSDEG